MVIAIIIVVAVILVALLFIGNEIVSGVFSSDNISQLAHIVGGLLGGGFGLAAASGCGIARALRRGGGCLTAGGSHRAARQCPHQHYQT